MLARPGRAHPRPRLAAREQENREERRGELDSSRCLLPAAPERLVVAEQAPARADHERGERPDRVAEGDEQDEPVAAHEQDHTEQQRKAATASGWTTAELAKMGLAKARSRGRRPHASSATKAPDAAGPTESGTSPTPAGAVANGSA